ncbi:hypothetical protein, partial [Burkholderia sp. SIMBA_052]|uniref:hypothetical protein n=1 Tax=Burkholderia sp. SIMBA_052 TaxID=3085793 RepID=UPI00397D1FA3
TCTLPFFLLMTIAHATSKPHCDNRRAGNDSARMRTAVLDLLTDVMFDTHRYQPPGYETSSRRQSHLDLTRLKSFPAKRNTVSAQ